GSTWRGATPPRKCAGRPPTGSGSRPASRRCARPSRSRRCRRASGASMAAPPWARPRSPRAWWLGSTRRASRTTADAAPKGTGAVLAELQVDGIRVVGVAEGPERKAGLERLFLSGQSEPTILPPASPALHLIQQVRDEAHRFAVTGHRLRRGRARTTSPLE